MTIIKSSKKMNYYKDIFLCSFASDDLNLSKKRFILQATHFYQKKNIKIYEPKNIKLKLKKKINDNLTKENRAFGYGIWKPLIVLDFFDRSPNNSIIQYADVGCHFNTKGLKRFKEYIEITRKYGSLVFNYDGDILKKKNVHLKFQKYFEYQYSKKDLINHLKIRKNSKILNSPQIWSGSFFLKKNQKNRKLLIKWIKIMEKNNLIDASISKKIENNKFIESRWDQSAFSILAKFHFLKKLSVSECEWAENNNGRVWSHLKKFPILAKRDLKRNVISRFMNRQKRTYRRYKARINLWRDGRAV